MTDAQFQRIKLFYNQCRHDESLPPQDPRYVDLSAKGIRGKEEPRKMLTRAITLSDNWTYQLFTGFSGSGKSTELRLLQHELRSATPYAVVYQDAEEIIDITQPLQITDILITLGAMANQALEEHLQPTTIKHAFKETFWDRFLGFFKKTKITLEGVDFKVGDKAASTTLKAKIRTDPTFRDRVRQHLGGHLQSFATTCKTFLDEVNAALKTHVQKEGMILILDSMEKITGHSLNASDVARSVQTTFYTNAQFLTDLPCHIIYTIPPFLHIMEPDLPKLYSGGNTQILPMCRVTTKGHRNAIPDAIDVLRGLLEKRVDLKELLGDDWHALSERLILASGGYPRDLLLLVRHMLQLTESLPISSETLDQAIRKLFDTYQEAIYEGDLKWLARIAISHDKELLDEAQLMRLANLFRSHVVMCYYNGSPWYDLHPAVYKMERIQQTIEHEKHVTNPDNAPTP